MLSLVLVPGLLAAGVGSLIFTGLDAWTGLGTFSLAIPGLPHFGHPDIAEFGWAVVIGVAAALVGPAISWLAQRLEGYASRWPLIITPLAGLTVAALAIAYAQGTGKGSGQVLSSGQTALPSLIRHGATYTVGALVLLMACKGLAYCVSLASFRGGPVFPAMFIGAAGGIALSHLPGLPLVAGVAMGIGAMSVVMLNLPLTSVLLASLLLASDGLAVMPLVIVAVVVAYVAAARIQPAAPNGASAPQQPAARRKPAGGTGPRHHPPRLACRWPRKGHVDESDAVRGRRRPDVQGRVLMATVAEARPGEQIRPGRSWTAPRKCMRPAGPTSPDHRDDGDVDARACA